MWGLAIADPGCPRLSPDRGKKASTRSPNAARWLRSGASATPSDALQVTWMTRGRHPGTTAASARADRSSRRRHAGQMRGTRRPSAPLRTGRVGLARPRTQVPDRHGPWRAVDGLGSPAQQPGARAPAAHGHDAARSASSPSSTTAVALAATTARPARKRSSRPRTGRGTNPTGSRRGRRATHIRSGRRKETRGELPQPRSTPAGRSPPHGVRRGRAAPAGRHGGRTPPARRLPDGSPRPGTPALHRPDDHRWAVLCRPRSGRAGPPRGDRHGRVPTSAPGTSDRRRARALRAPARRSRARPSTLPRTPRRPPTGDGRARVVRVVPEIHDDLPAAVRPRPDRMPGRPRTPVRGLSATPDKNRGSRVRASVRPGRAGSGRAPGRPR
jgi:hypothetical protein